MHVKPLSQWHSELSYAAAAAQLLEELETVHSTTQLGELLASQVAAQLVAQVTAVSAPQALVERFDRRGIEPFELFTSEFGQNSVKIQYILLGNSEKLIQDFSTF